MLEITCILIASTALLVLWLRISKLEQQLRHARAELTMFGEAGKALEFRAWNLERRTAGLDAKLADWRAASANGTTMVVSGLQSAPISDTGSSDAAPEARATPPFVSQVDSNKAEIASTMKVDDANAAAVHAIDPAAGAAGIAEAAGAAAPAANPQQDARLQQLRDVQQAAQNASAHDASAHHAAPTAPTATANKGGGNGGNAQADAQSGALGGSLDLEQWIGVRGAAALGAMLLVLAGIYFFQYSIEHNLLTPSMRVLLGTLVGIGCIAGSELRLRKTHEVLAHWLSGAGAAILYLSFWAASAMFWPDQHLRRWRPDGVGHCNVLCVDG